MVGQVLGKDHEGHRRVGHEQRQQVGAVDAAPVRLEEHEVRQGDQRGHGGEGAVVDDAEAHVAGVPADQAQDACQGVARHDADHEGDQLGGALAEGGGQHGHGQGHQTAEQADLGIAALNVGGHEQADGVGGQRQADDGHDGPDDDRGHELVDPLDAAEFHDQRQDHIDGARDARADDQPRVAHRHGGGAGEGREHGADEGEGGAQEHRACVAGKEQIDHRAAAGAEEGGGGGHPVADGGGDGDGGHHDGQQLLEGGQHDLSEGGLVLDSVSELHCGFCHVSFSLSLSYR